MESRCWNSWFGSHKFQPRYDLGPADLSRFESISGNGAGSFMEKLRQQTYVHDVCVKCGKVVSRGEAAGLPPDFSAAEATAVSR